MLTLYTKTWTSHRNLFDTSCRKIGTAEAGVAQQAIEARVQVLLIATDPDPFFYDLWPEQGWRQCVERRLEPRGRRRSHAGEGVWCCPAPCVTSADLLVALKSLVGLSQVMSMRRILWRARTRSSLEHFS